MRRPHGLLHHRVTRTCLKSDRAWARAQGTRPDPTFAGPSFPRGLDNRKTLRKGNAKGHPRVPFPFSALRPPRSAADAPPQPGPTVPPKPRRKPARDRLAYCSASASFRRTRSRFHRPAASCGFGTEPHVRIGPFPCVCGVLNLSARTRVASLPTRRLSPATILTAPQGTRPRIDGFRTRPESSAGPTGKAARAVRLWPAKTARSPARLPLSSGMPYRPFGRPPTPHPCDQPASAGPRAQTKRRLTDVRRGFLPIRTQ